MANKRCSRCRGTKAGKHFVTPEGKARETCNECRGKDVQKRKRTREQAKEVTRKLAESPSSCDKPPPMSSRISTFSLADPFGPPPSPSPPPQPRQPRKPRMSPSLMAIPPVFPAPGHPHHNVSPDAVPPPGYMILPHEFAMPVTYHGPPSAPMPLQHRSMSPVQQMLQQQPNHLSPHAASQTQQHAPNPPAQHSPLPSPGDSATRQPRPLRIATPTHARRTRSPSPTSSKSPGHHQWRAYSPSDAPSDKPSWYNMFTSVPDNTAELDMINAAVAQAMAQANSAIRGGPSRGTVKPKGGRKAAASSTASSESGGSSHTGLQN